MVTGPVLNVAGSVLIAGEAVGSAFIAGDTIGLASVLACRQDTR